MAPLDMLRSLTRGERPRRIVIGFVAGFVGTLIFHQGMLGTLHALGIAPIAPFSLQPTSPLGVPEVWSLAFWGGVWGIAYAFAEGLLTRWLGYWLGATLFGAILPTLAFRFIVMPLKDIPAGNVSASLLITGLLVNAAWGLGTAFFFMLGMRRKG